MKRVWITRSEPGASELARVLAAAHFAPILEPVIKIRATNFPRPSGNIELAVFLSTHAVNYACQHKWQTEYTIAIGPATASVLEQHDIRAVVPETHDSEGVLALIRQRFSEVQEVTIVCGRNSRPLLREALENDGIKVCEWCVYERFVDTADTPIDLCFGDWISVGSREGLAAVANTWDTRCSISKSSINVVTPSNRIAEVARFRGFTNVIVSAGASADATLSTLMGANNP